MRSMRVATSILLAVAVVGCAFDRTGLPRDGGVGGPDAVDAVSGLADAAETSPPSASRSHRPS